MIIILVGRMRYRVVEYLTSQGDSPFRNWLSTLSVDYRARIQARIARLETGNFGDFKAVGFGVLEARLFFGGGFRIYFSIVGRELVLILVGGDKRRQSRDILLARKYLEDFKRRNLDGKKKRRLE